MLQQKLNGLTKLPMRTGDLKFNDYIKEKTGYKIDIFESLHIRVDEIIKENKK